MPLTSARATVETRLLRRSFGQQPPRTRQDAVALFGWHIRRSPAKLIGEASLRERFGLARAWLSDGHYEMRSHERMYHVCLILEGVADFVLEGESGQLQTNELLIVEGTADLSMLLRGPVVGFAWWLTPTVLDGAVFRSMFAEPIPIGKSGRETMTSTSNALLNNGHLRESPATREYGLGIEHLIAGTLKDRPAFRSLSRRRSGNQGETLLYAQGLIEARFRDPSFTVAGLARAMNLTPQKLHRLYQQIGTSGGKELTRRRVAEAMMYLQDSHPSDPQALRVVATRCGFTSSRHLRDTLRRHPEGASHRLEHSNGKRRRPPRPMTS